MIKVINTYDGRLQRMSSVAMLTYEKERFRREKRKFYKVVSEVLTLVIKEGGETEIEGPDGTVHIVATVTGEIIEIRCWLLGHEDKIYTTDRLLPRKRGYELYDITQVAYDVSNGVLIMCGDNVKMTKELTIEEEDEEFLKWLHS